MHKAGTHLRDHDDHEQFLNGIDLILAGIAPNFRPAWAGNSGRFTRIRCWNQDDSPLSPMRAEP